MNTNDAAATSGASDRVGEDVTRDRIESADVDDDADRSGGVAVTSFPVPPSQVDEAPPEERTDVVDELARARARRDDRS